ncbi:hypothetical protein DV736_g4390, partial [Chaetothyriales sp. CBS 134916]
MSALKRKSDDGDINAKAEAKRPRSERKSKSSSEKGKDGKSNTASIKDEKKPKKEKAPAKSLLSKEQALFPRGGADVLTPIEKKQIHAQAARDAAKEQARLPNLFNSAISENESAGEESQTNGKSDQSNDRKKKKASRKKSKHAAANADLETTKITGLSYKRLNVGSLIFGQVTAISQKDVTVALPNNLVGYIPLGSVSKQFSARLAKLLENGDSNDESGGNDDNNDDDDSVSLQTIFHVGQYLRVAVTSTSQETSAGEVKRRIELSTEPALVNAGLNKSSLSNNVVVQAAIVSVEDHGVVVDLDLEDYPIRGFVQAKSLVSEESLSDLQEGAVLLCQVADITSDGQVVKLTADPAKQRSLKSAATIDSYLPGTVTDVLVSEVQDVGVVGKLLGLVDMWADLVHSGSYRDRESFQSKYPLGKKLRCRILYKLSDDESVKMGFSLLPHLVDLDVTKTTALILEPELPPSTITDAEVVRVEPGLGVYLNLGSDRSGFAHVSRLSDSRVDSLSETTGSYKFGSHHLVRLLDFNPVDGLYILSLQKSILDQPFLRPEDVPVGTVMDGAVEKIVIGPNGVSGVVVKLAEGITGFAPEMHLSDAQLQNPENRFREGLIVKARVLSVDRSNRRIRLTLKKTLVNSDSRVWTDYASIQTRDSSLGTIVKVDSRGAVVHFYGSVTGFLPVAEMSEAYIKNPQDHFRSGQVVTVNALSVNADEQRLTLTCRTPASANSSNSASLLSIKAGTLVTGVVFEKSQDDVLLRLQNSDAIARLTLDHVSDGSEKKRKSALGKIRVGQKLEGLLVLDVQPKQRLVVLSNKQGLLEALHKGSLLTSVGELEVGRTVTGFISNITPAGVFVAFTGAITGLIPPSGIPPDAENEADFGMKKLQTVTTHIFNIDYKGATPRFWLSLRDAPLTAQSDAPSSPLLVEPVDPKLQSEDDLVINKVTKARIVSVKDSQLNVDLAKNIQGRIDVSEIFDKWEDIKDRKKPLRQFSAGQVLAVKILGAHDTRNHRFLPLTHRKGKNTVFELTAKPSTIAANDSDPISFEALQPGSSRLAYVNNVMDDGLWVSLSPSVRGWIRAIDVSEDLSLAANLAANFPTGSALRVRVVAVDAAKGRLDLTARSGDISRNVAFGDLSPGLILPGRVTKVSDHQLIVQVSDHLAGVVSLIDLADDFSEANPAKYQKNEIVRACVLRVDEPNKKLFLSLRPSRVLNSSLKPTDPEITSVEQLAVQDIRRGFIRNVSNQGIFITLGHDVTAFVRIAHLSDAYVKEWQNEFQKDQLVEGKIIKVDKASGHVQMSLKESVLTGTYTAPISFTDLKPGDIVTGKAAKVEEFGVFILVNNSENVRGLCHRSEIAERRVEDATKLFTEGDVLKAKVLKVDAEKRRISFGLKASYFEDDAEDEAQDSDASSGSNDESLEGGARLPVSDHNAVHVEAIEEDESSSDERPNGRDDGHTSESDEDEAHTVRADPTENASSAKTSLRVGGFDWHGVSDHGTAAKRGSPFSSADDTTEMAAQKKRKKRADIQTDRTGDLDANGPQLADDYERLLLGQPDSSLLWLQYMAFHLELGDVDQAREIGERALKSIGLGEYSEKLNVWVALLNLENVYGDDNTLDALFKRACEFNDLQEMHARLTSIYIHSGKEDKADDMFQTMLKKFSQDPKVWINYATFLFDTTDQADKARNLLPRALQMLPKFTHLDLTSKFAQLEFKASGGLPERGRTMFEGLIASFPKRIDFYNVLLDLELKLGDKEQIRGLFERVFRSKLKAKQAKYFFKRWLAFEESQEDERRIEDVKAKAATWIRSAGGEGL